MAGLKVSSGDWVVVCDGRKALILENIGDHISPKSAGAEGPASTRMLRRVTYTNPPIGWLSKD